ncbi:MAG: hypothetical protein AAFQ81_07670 [Pseudomonadota bacterium]
MQTLDIVARLVPAVANGSKRSTIRWGEGPIRPGPLRLVCADPPSAITVEVWRVTSMPLREAAAFLGREVDWPDAVMQAGMREHYPAIMLDCDVQVVEFHPPSPA